MIRFERMSLFLLCIFIIGCAGPASYLKPEQVASVKKIAVIVVPLSQSPQILDHTETWGKSYTYGMFGAAGALLEGLVLSVEAGIAKKDSLGGDAGSFLIGVKPFTIQEDLETGLRSRFAGSFELIDPKQLQALCEQENAKCSVGDYLELARNQGADLLLYLKYVYGLAAFKGAPASAAVDSQMFVYETPHKKIIFRKDISSIEAFKRQDAIDRFSADSFVVYKEDMSKATDAMALLVANELGLFKDETSGARKQAANDEFGRFGINTDFMSTLSVDCDHPAKMGQSCNALTGPNKRIRFDKVRASIAGSADGKIVMVMFGTPMKMVDQIVREAEEHGIKIERATKFGTTKTPEGYILFSDGDLYSVLSKHGY